MYYHDRTITQGDKDGYSFNGILHSKALNIVLYVGDSSSYHRCPHHCWSHSRCPCHTPSGGGYKCSYRRRTGGWGTDTPLNCHR